MTEHLLTWEEVVRLSGLPKEADGKCHSGFFTMVENDRWTYQECILEKDHPLDTDHVGSSGHVWDNWVDPGCPDERKEDS